MIDILKIIYRIIIKILNPFNDIYNSAINGIVFGVITIFLFFATITAIDLIKVINEPETTIRIITLTLIALGVYVAIWKLNHDHRWNQSETYLKQTLDLIEKSFNTISNNISEKNNRNSWISSASLILSSEALSKKISDPSHKYIYEEYTEYWKQQFRELIMPNGIGTKNKHFYYENDILVWSIQDRAPIPLESITVIYRYMAIEKIYRLKKGDIFTEKEIKNIEFYSEGLFQYINEYEKINNNNAVS